MSQSQPLSTLAPKYDKVSTTVEEIVITKEPVTQIIVDIECNKKEPECKKKKPECPIDKCKQSCYNGWEWLGALILWFIIFTVLFWLIYYSLKPPFVLQSDSNQVDTAKVLLAAVISSIILVVIIWLIKTAIKRRYY
jgi:hypothetical protein